MKLSAAMKKKTTPKNSTEKKSMQALPSVIVKAHQNQLVSLYPPHDKRHEIFCSLSMREKTEHLASPWLRDNSWVMPGMVVQRTWSCSDGLSGTDEYIIAPKGKKKVTLHSVPYGDKPPKSEGFAEVRTDKCGTMFQIRVAERNAFLTLKHL